MRMFATLAMAVAALTAPSYQDARAAALADYATFQPSDVGYIRYLDWTKRPEFDAADVEAIHAFYIPHQSRAGVIERQMPVAILIDGQPCGMWRIDLRDLQWDLDSWYQVAREYPYAPDHPNPLIVRGDWLVWITSDGTLSQLHYHLLYGFNKGPQNRADYFAFWKVDEKQSNGLDHATIFDAEDSGVALETRLMVERRTVGGWSYETFDSLRGNAKNDPLGQLRNGLKNFQYDAGELITSFPKVELRTGRTWYAQAMLLTDGKGNRVEEANAQIVHDKAGKHPVITNPGKCFMCHTVGILDLPPNLTRGIAQRGGETWHYSKDDAAEFERKFLGELQPIVKRAQEDFCGWLPRYTKLSTPEVVALYQSSVNTFAAKVSIHQAALELHMPIEDFVQASNLYASRAGELPARYVQLLGGDAIPRKVWQTDVYPLAYQVTQSYLRN